MQPSNLPAVVPFNELERMAQAVAKSGLFGIKTTDQAIALMLVAQAEGLHPAIAARDFHIIQGRPALKADAMLARFQNAGGRVKWTCLTEQRACGVFSHPSGGEIELDWTMEQAQRAGLAGKDNWRQYPRAMLRSRVVSEGIRTVFPGVIAGYYTPEETADMAPEPNGNGNGNGHKRELKDVTPARTPADDLRDFAGDPAAKTETAKPTVTDVDYDPATGEVIDPQARQDPEQHPHRIAVGIVDGESDWPGFCAAVKEAYMQAPDEETLLAIREDNKDALGALGGGGKGGRAAADRLHGIFTGCQLELQRKAALAAHAA